MLRQIATQSPVEILVQKNAHLGRRDGVRARFFEECDHLLAFYAREPLKKLLDGIARLQVIEKTFHWYPGPDKNRLAAKNLRVLRYDAAHTERLIQQATRRKTSLLLGRRIIYHKPLLPDSLLRKSAAS